MHKRIFTIIILSICLLLTGCQKDITITDVPQTKQSFKPISASVYRVQLKPYNRFSTNKITTLKNNVHVSTHRLGSYAFYGKTNRFALWDDNVSFVGEWFEDGVLMPYGLFTPTDFCEYDDLPLVVYLHGSGSKGKTSEHFMSNGVQKLFQEWPLEGFRAYIVCPQLARGFNNGSWYNPTSKGYLQELLDYLLENYNIDENSVYIMGHSLGGQGAMYMAHEMPEYFKACVSLSPYSPGVDMKEVTMPFRAYLGTLEGGEDERCLKYTANLRRIFGEDSITFFECTHGQVPLRTFKLDANRNNRSDVLEWLFEQKQTE